MSDTNILLAGALLAVGLLWPAQGHAYCPLLASEMEQALCNLEARVKAQQSELELLDMRVKEIQAAQDRAYVAETLRSIEDEKRRRADAARDSEARQADFLARLPRYGQP